MKSRRAAISQIGLRSSALSSSVTCLVISLSHPGCKLGGRTGIMGRRPGNALEKWEVAIVKAMLARKYVPQDIQAYFSRPTRSINHARISEIRDGAKHKIIRPASDPELDAFLEAWPTIDPATGLHLQGDELLVKAREAMIAAPHFQQRGASFPSRAFHRHQRHCLDVSLARLLQAGRH